MLLLLIDPVTECLPSPRGYRPTTGNFAQLILNQVEAFFREGIVIYGNLGQKLANQGIANTSNSRPEIPPLLEVNGGKAPGNRRYSRPPLE